jgi:hypothetical protein
MHASGPPHAVIAALRDIMAWCERRTVPYRTTPLHIPAVQGASHTP